MHSFDSSEINGPYNNANVILSRCTTVESNLTSGTVLIHDKIAMYPMCIAAGFTLFTPLQDPYVIIIEYT